MRIECLVCAVALAAMACSGCGSESGTPTPGPSAGGPATDGVGQNGAQDPASVAPPMGPGGLSTSQPAAMMPMPAPSDPADPVNPAPDPAVDPASVPGPAEPGAMDNDPSGTGAMNPSDMEPADPQPQTCPADATGAPGRTLEMVDNGGVTRRYILYVPSSYTGQAPVPLMVNFHPLLTDGAAAESGSGYKALADREGFIVAFPDGQESAAWNVGPCCTQSREVDDVGFARALVAQVQSKYCVDEKRIYASGFSMGGGMTHYLACEAADLFAAVAPGAFDLFEENTCAPSRPITVISFRSMSDLIVPYAGGVKQSAPNGFRGTHTFVGAVGTFERWAEINGCTGQPEDEGAGCMTHKQCTDGVEVTLCTVSGGHTWPDAERSWQTLSRFSLP